MNQSTILDWEKLPVMLNAKTVAIIMNCSRTYVYKLCNAGSIPAVKVSKRKWLIPKDKLQNYLEGRD